jgi:hypothetical protein
MKLSNQEIKGLMRLIGLTEDDELNCDQCQALVAQFAEHKLADRPITEGLKAVEQHLSVCGECREEYEVLQRILTDLKS